MKEIIKRDKERKCWTTGQERIEAVCNEFENLKELIGAENYIDTTNQLPIETLEILHDEIF